MIPGSIERDAVRILFILYFCGTRQLQLPFHEDSNDSRRLDSETKLQKFDFWLRYPDHFAAALLHECNPEGSLLQRKDEIKGIVRQIFNEREPTLRWVPMRKYLRGAYEQLDMVMAYLSGRKLAYRRVTEWRHRTEYFLTQKGGINVEQMIQNCEECHWYVHRCRLMFAYFEHWNGFNIRKLQYVQGEYKASAYFEAIGRIDNQVKELFKELYGEDL